MRLFRVAKAAHAQDLRGTGARLMGGRWNSRGNAVLYASGDADTALKEVTGSGVPMALLRQSYVLVEIEVEGRRGLRFPSMDALPTAWDQVPFDTPTQVFGDDFLADGVLLFRVPSIRKKGGWNYVLNPDHPEYADRVRVVNVTPISDLPTAPSAPGNR